MTNSDRLEKTVILHVGHGKTGSSAIQSYLASNQALLMEYGIYYPLHMSFERARQGKTTSGNLSAFISPVWSPVVIKESESAPCTKVLFSNEGLFPRILDDSSPLHAVTKKFNLKIILYVRNPADHAISAYGQAIKRQGERREIDHWISSYNRPAEVRHFLNICRGLNIPVSIKNYSRTKSLEKGFVRLILDDKAEEFYAKSVKLRSNVNRSLTRSECELQRQFNRYCDRKTSRLIAESLVDNLPDIPSENDQISAPTLQNIRARFQDVIDEINLSLGEGEKLEVHECIPPSENDEIYCFSKEQLGVLARSVSDAISKERNDGRLDRRILRRARLYFSSAKKALKPIVVGATVR